MIEEDLSEKNANDEVVKDISFISRVEITPPNEVTFNEMAPVKIKPKKKVPKKKKPKIPKIT